MRHEIPVAGSCDDTFDGIKLGGVLLCLSLQKLGKTVEVRTEISPAIRIRKYRESCRIAISIIFACSFPVGCGLIWAPPAILLVRIEHLVSK